MDLINAFLETLKQGGKQSRLNLTMIPLPSSNEGEPDYIGHRAKMSQVPEKMWIPMEFPPFSPPPRATPANSCYLAGRQSTFLCSFFR